MSAISESQKRQQIEEIVRRLESAPDSSWWPFVVRSINRLLDAHDASQGPKLGIIDGTGGGGGAGTVRP